MIVAPVRLWAIQLGPHLRQGPQTLAQGPTQRQYGRLRKEGEASIRLLGRRWQTLEADRVAVWQEQAGPESDASWAPAQGAAGLCTSDPLKGRQDWARALLPRGHPHAPGPWPPRKTRDQEASPHCTAAVVSHAEPTGKTPMGPCSTIWSSSIVKDRTTPPTS